LPNQSQRSRRGTTTAALHVVAAQRGAREPRRRAQVRRVGTGEPRRNDNNSRSSGSSSSSGGSGNVNSNSSRGGKTALIPSAAPPDGTDVTNVELEVDLLPPSPSPSLSAAAASTTEGDHDIDDKGGGGGGGGMAALTGGRGMTIAGVPLTPEVTAIVLVYFVQGILGLSRLAKVWGCTS